MTWTGRNSTVKDVKRTSERLPIWLFVFFFLCVCVLCCVCGFGRLWDCFFFVFRCVGTRTVILIEKVKKKKKKKRKNIKLQSLANSLQLQFLSCLPLLRISTNKQTTNNKQQTTNSLSNKSFSSTSKEDHENRKPKTQNPREYSQKKKKKTLIFSLVQQQRHHPLIGCSDTLFWISWWSCCDVGLLFSCLLGNGQLHKQQKEKGIKNWDVFLKERKVLKTKKFEELTTLSFSSNRPSSFSFCGTSSFGLEDSVLEGRIAWTTKLKMVLKIFETVKTREKVVMALLLCFNSHTIRKTSSVSSKKKNVRKKKKKGENKQNQTKESTMFFSSHSLTNFDKLTWNIFSEQHQNWNAIHQDEQGACFLSFFWFPCSQEHTQQSWISHASHKSKH